MDCQAAAAALCHAIGLDYGPLVLFAITNALGFLALYIKSNRTAKATREATDEIKAEVAQTKALVSVRPPPVGVSLEMPSGVPRAAPLPVVTTTTDEGLEP
jgi:hypothetical protein